MKGKRPRKVALLGADKFILALEYHDRRDGTSGNTCRYVLNLSKDFNVQHFKNALRENQTINWLARFELSGKLSNSNYWKQGPNVDVSVQEIESDEQIPSSLLNKKQNCYTAPLFFFHIVKRSDQTYTLFFSWHHLLMDGYGATLFLKSLINEPSIKPISKVKSPFNFKVFKEMARAKKFITQSSAGETAELESSFKTKVNQAYKIIEFSEQETAKIDRQAISHGARFGPGPYLLSASTNCVNDLLVNKGISQKDFWIPVPQDNRKRGSTWPISGNHLSFLFYRIGAENLGNKKDMVGSLNEQMMNQMKKGIPTAYSHLMNYLRKIPSPIYTRLIKGNNRKSLSSFLFTVAAEHPKDFSEFFGGKILNVLSIPPNTYPPGVTFAFNRFNNQLKIVLLTYQHIISDTELITLEKNLRKELLGE